MKRGSNTISSVKKGSSVIHKIYKGSTLVYTSGMLPNEYQQVEYIQSTSKEWLEINYIPNQDTRVIVDYALMQVGSGFIFGCRDSVSSNSFSLNCGSNKMVSYTSYGDSGNQTYNPSSDTKRHVVDKNKNEIYLDGELKLILTKQTFTCPDNLEIFATYNGGTKGYLPLSIKMYSFVIFDNDTLVCNLIPCYRKSDNAVGMYDLVKGVFYENQGDGAFLKGSDVDFTPAVLPSRYQKVDYIEGTGTQYIDTRVNVDEDVGVYMKLRLMNTTEDKTFFGSHANNLGWWVGAGGTALLYFRWYNSTAYSVHKVNTSDIFDVQFNYRNNGLYKTEFYNVSKIIDKTTTYSNPIWLFGRYNGTLLRKMKMYECKITKGDKLIRHFIPCYRKSDNTIGLYDVVNNTFYTNAGTGTFLKGTDVFTI